MKSMIYFRNKKEIIKIISFAAIVSIEVIIISFICGTVFYRDKIIQVAPIPKKYIFNPVSDLDHFYEFTPNNIIFDKQDWLPYTPVYNINSDGLNEGFDYQPQKNEKTVRIITLGDSHTFGYLVSTPNNYPEKLEHLLNKNCSGAIKFEVINLGIPGYDLQYSVERFRNRGIKYNPDIILWFVKKDDFSELKEKTAPKIAFYRDHPDVEEQQSFIKKGYHYYEVYKANKDVLEELGTENILKKQIEFLNQFASYYSNKLVFFSYDDSDVVYFEKQIQQFISSRTETYFYRGIPALYKFDRLHLKDGHPNEEGYMLLAEYLFDYLKSNKILICN